MRRRLSQHEAGTCLTYLRAVQHDRNVLDLRMFSAHRQAVPDCLGANRSAVEARIDTAPHFLRNVGLLRVV